MAISGRAPVSGKVAQRMHKIRRRIVDGKASDIERQMLARYERDHPSKKPRITAPAVENGMQGPGAKVGQPRPSAENGGALSDPPHEPSPSDSSGSDGEGPPPLVVAEAPREPTKAEVVAADELEARAASKAKMFTGWLLRANKEIRELGGEPLVPDELIEEVVFPAARDLAKEYAPDIEMGPTAKKLVVVGAGAATIVQRARVREIARKRRDATAPAAPESRAPAPASASPPAPRQVPQGLGPQRAGWEKSL